MQPGSLHYVAVVGGGFLLRVLHLHDSQFLVVQLHLCQWQLLKDQEPWVRVKKNFMILYALAIYKLSAFWDLENN